MSGTKNTNDDIYTYADADADAADLARGARRITQYAPVMKNGDPNGEWTGSWREWARHVLMELKRLNEYCDDIDDRLVSVDSRFQHDLSEVKNGLHTRISDMKDAVTSEQQKINIALATLNVKAGVWGAIGAGVITIGSLLTFLIAEYIKR